MHRLNHVEFAEEGDSGWCFGHERRGLFVGSGPIVLDGWRGVSDDAHGGRCGEIRRCVAVDQISGSRERWVVFSDGRR